jgi:hypothetical protein
VSCLNGLEQLSYALQGVASDSQANGITPQAYRTVVVAIRVYQGRGRVAWQIAPDRRRAGARTPNARIQVRLELTFGVRPKPDSREGRCRFDSTEVLFNNVSIGLPEPSKNARRNTSITPSAQKCPWTAPGHSSYAAHYTLHLT